MKSLRILGIAATCAAVFGIAACSDSDSGKKADAAAPAADSAAATPSASANPMNDPIKRNQAVQEVSQAIQKYYRSYYTGDPKYSHEALSVRCRAGITEADFVAKAQKDREQYGVQQVSTIKIPGLTQVDRATVDYELQAPALTVTGETWILENGFWHRDAC